jgi:deoxyribodipyrimidine photolyase-like uncharacterized protein
MTTNRLMKPKRAPALKLILGDQLNCRHSWFAQPSDDVVFVMMEVRQETDYVLHHAQKIIAIFAAMRDLARRLRDDGHRVHYLAIDDTDNRQSLPANLDHLIEHYGAGAFAWQAPDEWRLDRQLKDYAAGLSIPAAMADTEHFYTARDEAARIFEGRPSWLMEFFYRRMRARPNTLGMSQYADGGMLATKPYVSSAAYIDRMSDYCKGCHYDKKARTGERACPYNALYWDFFDRNRATLAGNQRLGMVYQQLRRMDGPTIEAIRRQATHTRANLADL